MRQLNVKVKGTKEVQLVYQMLLGIYENVKDGEYYTEVKTDFLAWWNTFNQHKQDFFMFDRFRECCADEKKLTKFGKIISYHLSKLYHVRETDWKFYFHGDEFDKNGIFFTIPGELIEYDYDEFQSRLTDESPYQDEIEWDGMYSKALEKYIKEKLQNNEPIDDNEFDHEWFYDNFSDVKYRNYKNHIMYKLFNVEKDV